MAFKASKYQEAFFEWVRTGTGSAVLNAVAGSGKTTSIIKSLEFVPPECDILFLAFNKSIAEELKPRMPANAQAMTLNSLGYRAWLKFAGSCTLNTSKTQDIINDHLNAEDGKRVGFQVKKMVDLAKQLGIVPGSFRHADGLVPDTTDTWLDLIDHFDIDFGDNLTPAEEGRRIEEAIAFARTVLTVGLQERRNIDFADQIYMPVVFGAQIPTFDFVYIDEAQDVSDLQRAMVTRAVKPTTGRLVAVGDNFQAIYGWRGAANDSIERFVKDFSATILPLSICYRCPTSHLALAKEIVPHIEAAPGAAEGEIVKLPRDFDPKTFQNDDLIICRNGAPLVKLAYRFLKAKVAVRVLGRDLGVGLVSLIKRLKPKDMDHLELKLKKWAEQETTKLILQGKEEKVHTITDKVEAIQCFIENNPSASIPGLIAAIEALYSDNTKGILTLASVHKSKGLEADRVFILNEHLMPSKYAKKEWAKKQEMHLIYVARTRAKKVLGFITQD